jgi:hypothetical protein
MIPHHCGVAGEFLVEPNDLLHDVDQRVEPEEAACKSTRGVDDEIAALDVHPLVRENQRPLLRCVASLEVTRDDDFGSQDADYGGATRGMGGAEHSLIGSRHHPEAGNKLPLLTRESPAEQ